MSGQLNALIYSGGEFSAAYVDDLSQRTVCRAQTGSAEAHSVVWAHNAVELLAEPEHGYAACRVKCSGAMLRIPVELLYCEADGSLHSGDYTDYILPLREGERVGAVAERGGRLLAKLDGVLGWADQSRFTSR